MRIAVLSDVHGNIAALEAVLSAAEVEGVAAYWVLGDLVAYGPRPAEVLERVRVLPELRCVRGNTDRYVLTGDVSGMIPRIDDPQTADEERILADVHESLAWTRARVAGADRIEWLDARPVQERFTLPDRSRVLLAHASPGKDDGPGARPEATDAELSALGFTAEAADLVLVGHTHRRLDRAANGTLIVNPGPVSLPRTRDGFARWALLSVNDTGCEVELRRATYDVGEVVDDLHRVDHPAAAWISTRLASDDVSQPPRRPSSPA